MSWHHFDRGHSHKSRQSPTLCCDTAEIWPGFGVVAHPLPATTNRANTPKKWQRKRFSFALLWQLCCDWLIQVEGNLRTDAQTDVQCK